MVGTCKCLRHEQDEFLVEREQEQEGGIGRFEGYFASMLLIERFAVVGFLSTMHGSLLRVRQVPGVTMQ